MTTIRGRWAVWGLLAGALAAAQPSGATACEIAAQAEAIYAAAQAELNSRMSRAREVDFPPIDEVGVQVDDTCVLELTGQLTLVKDDKKNTVERRQFFARAKGQGGGWEMLKVGLRQ